MPKAYINSNHYNFRAQSQSACDIRGEREIVFQICFNFYYLTLNKSSHIGVQGKFWYMPIVLVDFLDFFKIITAIFLITHELFCLGSHASCCHHIFISHQQQTQTQTSRGINCWQFVDYGVCYFKTTIRQLLTVGRERKVNRIRKRFMHLLLFATWSPFDWEARVI